MSSDFVTDEIKRRLSLVKIVGETVHLKRSGSGFIGCCPFHKEKTPSFHVYPVGNSQYPFPHYKCFGCGKNGDVIEFVKERDNISFQEAKEQLAARAGIFIDKDKGKEQKRPRRRKATAPDAHPSKQNERPAARVPGAPSPQSSSSSSQAMPAQELPDAHPVDGTPAPPVIDVIPPEYMSKSQSPKSVFITWLRTLFDEQLIRETIKLYHIGATRDGGTIFWQIDPEHRIRTGKVIWYNNNGHRIKAKDKKNDRPTWIHFIMKQRGLLPAAWSLSQCLFGEHLLTEYPSAPVALVEAEKTAVIASMAFKQYGFIWIATGGMQNGFNAARLAPLKDRKVIVFPDAGNGFDNWESHIREIAQTIHFESLSFSYLTKDKASDDEKQGGIDIADWIIRDIQASKQPVAQELPDAHPSKQHERPAAQVPGAPSPQSSSSSSQAMPPPASDEHPRRPGSVPSHAAQELPDAHPVDGTANKYEIPKSEILKAMIDKNPAIGTLCEKLQLEIVSETAPQSEMDVLDPSYKVPEKCPF